MKLVEFSEAFVDALFGAEIQLLLKRIILQKLSLFTEYPSYLKKKTASHKA